LETLSSLLSGCQHEVGIRRASGRWSGYAAGIRETTMELFAKLFDSLLVFVYHCFDRIVIHGYLSGLSRPEQVVYFFHEVFLFTIFDLRI
jgi:hypothetical protein